MQRSNDAIVMSVTGSADTVADAILEEMRANPNVASAVANGNTLDVTTVSPIEAAAAKGVANKLARLFPGSPVRWAVFVAGEAAQ